MKKAAWISILSMAALLGVQQHANAAELIYGFNDPTINGFLPNPATPVGKETLSESTTTGVTEGAGALEIASAAGQTYGGAQTTLVPSDFYNATSFNVSVTITTTPEVSGSPVYFDLVPVFFSTDGEIDPDTSNSANFANLGALAPGTYTYTINLAAYGDPDSILTSDSTPGQILTADQTVDPADAITGFQLTVEHGGGTATTLYVDNITVPSASTPEPASIGGLILGGGALLARRRKA